MKKNFEVELRGPITNKKITELVKFFRKNGKFKARKDRVLVCFFKTKTKKEFREGTTDLRVRTTNENLEIVLKIGKWGGSERREEYILHLHAGQFDAALALLANLGFDQGIWAVRRGEIFTHKGVEFSLVEVPNHSYYFEAEKMADTKQGVIRADVSIRKLCKSLGLAIFTDTEFHSYIDRLNKESNPKYHFKKYSNGYFKRSFGI